MTEVVEIHDVYKGFDKSFIVTATGGKFYAEKPEFKLEDIALALSKIARFNGHSDILYTVAQHSLMVAEIMELDARYLPEFADNNPLEGLLHDATEAYLSDVPAPMKQFLPDWKALDAGWEKQLRSEFALPPSKSEGCQRADWIALFVEAQAFMAGQGMNFQDPFGYRPIALLAQRYRHLPDMVREQGWRDVAENFMQAAERYARRSPVAQAV